MADEPRQIRSSLPKGLDTPSRFRIADNQPARARLVRAVRVRHRAGDRACVWVSIALPIILWLAYAVLQGQQRHVRIIGVGTLAVAIALGLTFVQMAVHRRSLGNRRLSRQLLISAERCSCGYDLRQIAEAPNDERACPECGTVCCGVCANCLASLDGLRFDGCGQLVCPRCQEDIGYRECPTCKYNIENSPSDAYGTKQCPECGFLGSPMLEEGDDRLKAPASPAVGVTLGAQGPVAGGDAVDG